MGGKQLERVWGSDEAERDAARFEQMLDPKVRARSFVSRQVRLRLWRITVALSLGLKRGLDVVGALTGLILLGPVFLLTMLAIKIEDGGPMFFHQVRVGWRGRPFPMIKFRSMVVNAAQLKAELIHQNESGAGVLFKMKRDPRVTRVGRLIRKLSIDELPQLVNVLRGEMSLVGPRPALPSEVARYTQAERARLEIKPGITCIWQVSGRSDIDFQGQVRLDLEYIRSQSIGHDLKILLKTIPAVLLGKGAY